jgi:ribonuclease Y
MNTILILILIILVSITSIGMVLVLFALKKGQGISLGENVNDNQLKKIRQTIRNEIELETKSTLLEEQARIHKQEEILQQQLSDLKESIAKREIQVEGKLERLDDEKAKIHEIKDELREIKSSLIEKKDELEEITKKQQKEFTQKLEEVAKYTQKQAKEYLLTKTKEEVGDDLLQWQTKFIQEHEEEAHIKAREIIALALQRCSSEVANEFTITTIKLRNEDEKGKIIGKSGRNIQWLEKTLGVELIIDDTPEIITVSGFSSIRRNVAKRTIELLLEDGRIHPALIEDMHEKAKAEIAQEIADGGQWAVNELNIYDFPAKLIRLIGRLKFRTSYGQNMLKHSVEMAKLAALIANDINASYPADTNPVDVDICIKGALLHDVGKGVDEDINPKADHITLGEKICDTFGLDWRIKKCVSSHHDESYYDKEHGFCIEAAIVDACDNLSGGRIGARKETAEAYYQRMNDLEKIANDTKGVTKSWIMRGSRELWVFFDTEQISSSDMLSLVQDIAQKIQTTVNYPGEIKVIGFWENKIVEYAR